MIGAAVVVVAVGGATYIEKTKTTAPKFRTEKVDRGDVTQNVTAAGTLSAVTTVHVGSQVSGIIAKLHVDFNSQVKKGQLLAELDPTPFQATVDQQKANLEKAQVEVRNMDVTLNRSKNLLAQGLIAQSDYDTAKANRDSSAASVLQARASLQQAVANLSYTKIESPIDGVVVDRQYDIGQTVAASFQAPVIFTIAQDMTKMQVLTNIDEADIGGIKVGQEASFTVDAFSDQTFHGAVSQIRLSPQTVQNVVTYPVVLDVANQDLKLKPGMTANVQVPVAVRHDVLRVANAALRFKPDPSEVIAVPKAQNGTPGAGAAAPAGTEPAGPAAAGSSGTEPAGAGSTGPRSGGAAAGGRAGGTGGRGGAGRPGGRGGTGGSRFATVYVEVQGGKLKPVSVRTSITDGSFTAVDTKDLKAGDAIVIGLATAKAGESTAGRAPSAPGGASRGPRM
ncbi:MAG TPA: efflux RND transporter periplasmic adaptor subunit [Thermoanaerobaculia bacterium]|nr:efflux RND transporter periplasmic adaptor subunit [Thermoanaerobaculia bacterium]